MKYLSILFFLLSCQTQETKVSELTNKELFGQMVMLGVKSKQLSSDEKRWFKEYAIGSVLLLKRNVSTEAEKFVSTIKHYQEHAIRNRYYVPLLIAVDQENGMISRLHGLVTTLPNNYALGVLNDSLTTELVAEISGKEMRSLGVHWSLSPVADVNSNPKNPIIGVRSFGEDPFLVKTHVNAYVKGLSKVNTLSSIKHFPGHGDTDFDSHYDKVVINRTLDELKAIDLIPFENLNSSNPASSVMISHIQLPKIDSLNLPASISGKIHSFIPKEYEGIIISDELEMNALAKFHNPYKSVQKMIELGTDVIIMARALKKRVDIDKMFHFIDSVAKSDISFRMKMEHSARKILRIKKVYTYVEPDLSEFKSKSARYQAIADSIFLSIPYSRGSKELDKNSNYSFSSDVYTQKIVQQYSLELPKNGNTFIQFIDKKNPALNQRNILVSLENPYLLDDFPNAYKYCFYNRYAPIKQIFNKLFGNE
jgi:beta-N-acetylhexosaminidase